MKNPARRPGRNTAILTASLLGFSGLSTYPSSFTSPEVCKLTGYTAGCRTPSPCHSGGPETKNPARRPGVNLLASL